MQDNFPTTLQEAVLHFANPDNALNFLVGMRWPNGVCCPRCGSNSVSFTAKRRVWTCEGACPKRRQFSIKVGTIMEDSPITLDKWLLGIWLIVSAKNGISSYEIHRSLGITQKSAWFLSHRIRLALQNGTIEKLKGQVEVDETYIGGKIKNMKGAQRARATKYGSGAGGSGKAIVLGMIERGGKVRAIHVPHRRKTQLVPKIIENVEKGSEIFSDSLNSYNPLKHNFAHQSVDHAIEYVNGQIHTNSIENFWSLLKRGIRGTYVSVEPMHLFRYLDEQVFRFNERKGTDLERFIKALSTISGRRLTYSELTSSLTPA